MKKKAPYFKESNLVFVCKKNYTDKINKENFANEEVKNSIVNAWYKDTLSNNFHKFYIGEIVKVLSI